MASLHRFTKDVPTEAKTTQPPIERIKLIHYSKLVTGKYQYRDKGKTPQQLQEEIMDMAVWIELAGGILEPVLVRKLDVDTYEIIAGHTRTGGSRYLVEEQGKSQYAFIPCIVKAMSDEDAEANTSFSNARKPATQAEILHEIEIAKKRLEKYPNADLKGRFVERFAKKYNMTPSVVGDYINISKNLGQECKKAFENGALKKSAAVALAALPEKEQNELLHAGVTSHKAIKQYKAEKDVSNNIEQTSILKENTVKENNMEKNNIKENNMKVTKLDTKNQNTITFINKEHETFYYEKLKEVRYQDSYHKALVYCLGICDDTRNYVYQIYDFKTGLVKSECLQDGWQTSGSVRVIRMAFNLYCNGMPSVSNYEDKEEQLKEAACYTPEELFCCSYAPYFWQAIQLRYPEYANK